MNNFFDETSKLRINEIQNKLTGNALYNKLEFEIINVTSEIKNKYGNEIIEIIEKRDKLINEEEKLLLQKIYVQGFSDGHSCWLTGEPKGE